MRLATLILFVLFVIPYVKGQQTLPNRCGTGLVMEDYFRKNPIARTGFESQQLLIRQKAVNRSMVPLDQQPVSYQIPVVFHILLPDPETITDSQILLQLEQLNTDFGGLNADSTKIPSAFKSLFGKSRIRFCLAVRNPANEPSTGINRKVYTGYSQPGVNDPVKKKNQGGIDAWDPYRFLNIWITRINGNVLGYSFLPGIPGLPEEEMGLVITNIGRTATHEIGHFLGLQHIWGANENISSCTDSDGIDDTPNQDQASFGNPVFPFTDACNPAAPGILFMNYMDYVDDASMVMFTNGQSSLMETVLLNASDRNPLLYSDGCTLATIYELDAQLKSLLSPLDNSQTCTGLQQPKLLVRNIGETTLQTLEIHYKLDNEPFKTAYFNINLPSFSEQVLNFSAINLTTGNHQLQFIVSTINDHIDSNPSNDTLMVDFSAIHPASLPLLEGFESGNLPAGWFFETSGKENWRITSLASNSGNNSLYFPNYEFNEMGKKADLLLRPVYTDHADSLVLHFSVATAVYSLTYQDTLEVLVSTDCGASYQSIYKKWSSELAIAPQTDYQFIPAAAQWKHEHLDLSAFRNMESIQLVFRNINQFGNNIYLDDISLEKIDFIKTDAALLQVLSPADRICSAIMEPQLLISNQGADTLKTVIINYKTDQEPVQEYHWQGSLARLEQEQVILPGISIKEGLHSFTAWISKANGATDGVASNDTLHTYFARRTAIPLPHFEGFESAIFPPSNWDLFTKGNGNPSWSQSSLTGYSGNSSAVSSNYNSIVARNSDLYTPLVSYGKVDSVYLSFRMAASSYNLADSSRLFSILLTTDCGKNYQTIYSKSGLDLATSMAAPTGAFQPNSASQWRKDSINLTTYLTGSGSFYLVFRDFNNQTNTVFLDDIKLYTKTLPDILKKEGLLISPTLFNRILTIQHYRIPQDLKQIRLFNSGGQLVYQHSYNGNAGTNIYLHLPDLSGGMYFIQLQYANRQVTRKLIKSSR